MNFLVKEKLISLLSLLCCFLVLSCHSIITLQEYLQTEHHLFHVLWIAPRSATRVCVEWRILKPPGGLLLTILGQSF